MRLAIGGRLLLAHLALSLLVIGAVQLSVRQAMRDELESQLRLRLQLAASALVAELERGADPAAATAALGLATGLRLSVIGPDGFLEADSAVPPVDLRAAGSYEERPELLAARAGGEGFSVRTSSTTGISSLYLALPASGGRTARAAATSDAFAASVERVGRDALLAAAAGLLLAGLLGYVAARGAAASAQSVTAVARRMADGDLAARAAPTGPTEFVEMGAALNRLAQQAAEQLGRVTAERDLVGAVLAAMEEAVVVLRLDGSILLANSAARFVLSIPKAAEGQPLVETVRFPALLDAVRQAAAGQAAALELTLQGPPRRELIGRAAPLPPGRDAAVVLVLRDVTELRRLEAVRREFVANASHELRTPVAVIRGYADTLAGGALADTVAAERFVAALARQAERLTALIDDLLDLSRVESGGLRLQPVAVDVEQALRRLAEGAGDRVRKKGLTLRLDAVEAELRVRADPRAIDMVLGNLLDNAIKYTPEGGQVSLGARVADGGVRMEVRDTGPGIEPQHLSRIFERFYRVDAGRSREVGGTGLGLAIAKHVAQQSGGDVGVESVPGKGSQFWLRLPPA